MEMSKLLCTFLHLFSEDRIAFNKKIISPWLLLFPQEKEKKLKPFF